MQGGSWQGPIERASCAPEPGGASSCPLGSQYACETLASRGVPSCSPNACIDTAENPIEDEPVADAPGAPADDEVDTDGNCLGNIEISGGRAQRCRPAGLQLNLSTRCKARGKNGKDGMGTTNQ